MESTEPHNGCTALQRVSEQHVGIMDNDERSLDALSELITSSVPGCRVAWTCSDERAAIDRCLSSEYDIDLLMLDMSLERMQGPSVCRRIRAVDWHMPILAMTSFSLHRYRDKAMLAGAQGLVSKNDEQEIVQAVRTMLRHQTFDGFESPATAYVRIRGERQKPTTLTVREEEVINLAADDGLLDREIAKELGISEATVRRHMHNILTKLGARTSRQAIAMWLSPHEG